MSQILQDIGKKLTREQIKILASEYNIPYASLMAVIKTETLSTGGYYPNTLIPVVRFENHKFHEFTGGKYIETNPTLSSVKFTNKFNLKGINEYYRFLQAYAIDKNAAIKATSWGLGQVMGFNYTVCAPTLNAFVRLMYKSEYDQLIAVLKYCEINNLLRHLRTKDWDAFAEGYNGKYYRRNQYHIKLANWYEQYSNEPEQLA